MKKYRKSPALEKTKQLLKEKEWRKAASKIATRVLYTLKKRGMSQRELADILGKSPQWVNKIVKGQQNLTIGTIKELEEALDIRLFKIPAVSSEKVISETKIIKMEFNYPIRKDFREKNVAEIEASYFMAGNKKISRKLKQA